MSDPILPVNAEYFLDRSLEEVLLDGKNQKPRKKICGAFLYEDTTTLLFSRTNYGKSLLTFQFAWAAATGTNFDPCTALYNECDPMKVLVIDLELESRDIFERHGRVLFSHNPLISNLRYLHEKCENKMMLGYALLDKIEAAAVQHQAKLVIIDNISKLLPDALKPDTATMVISMLDRIRQKTGCSIMVIGHTTKGNPLVCVQPTDYFGSSMLQNFFHELSFLDHTKDGKFFLSHSKTKHKDTFISTVPVFTRGEHPVVGVGFSFLSLQNLSDVQLPQILTPPKKTHSRNLAEFKKQIIDLSASGMSNREIARFIGVTHGAINQIFDST
jgi:hypothetical protein